MKANDPPTQNCHPNSSVFFHFDRHKSVSFWSGLAISNFYSTNALFFSILGHTDAHVQSTTTIYATHTRSCIFTKKNRLLYLPNSAHLFRKIGLQQKILFILYTARPPVARPNPIKGNLPLASGPQTKWKASRRWGPQKNIKTDICAMRKFYQKLPLFIKSNFPSANWWTQND